MGVVVVEATALEAIMNKLDRMERKLNELAAQPADEIIGPDEAAEILGITTNSLYRLCRCGDVPHMKQGRNYRFERGAVIAHMKGEKE